MFEPLVFDRKAVYMQRTADFVRAGYRHWISGEVRPDRLRSLTKKFARLYGVDQTRHQRATAKAKGDGCAVLLLYAPYAGTPKPYTAKDVNSTAQVEPNTASDAPYVGMHEPTLTSVHWILLVTAGDHPAHQLERLRDAEGMSSRVALTGYELVQLSRPGQLKPAWTWRMQSETYQGWRMRLIAAGRSHLPMLTVEVAQLVRTPGFAGCRTQSKKLFRLASGEWRRHHSNKPALVIPRHPYLQRLPDSGAPVSLWLRRYTNQTRVLPTPGGCLPHRM